MEVGTPFDFVNDGTRVAFDGAALIIDDHRFGLDEIERLGTAVMVDRSHALRNRLTAGISVFGNDSIASVEFVGDGGTERWGEWRPNWDLLDALLDNQIQPRLLHRTISTLINGGAVELGAPLPG
jgi:hypothetical protein